MPEFKYQLAILVPVYNSEKTIDRLVEMIYKELSELSIEIILVNDGSADKSEEVCNALANDHKSLKFISLRKNFGEHNAVMCGLNYLDSPYVIIIDDDFQNPPSEVIKLYNKIKEGYDVVYTNFDKKEHSYFRNFGSSLNNYFATHLINKPKDLYLSSFKAIAYDVVQEVIKYKGPFPYLDGLILRVTNNIGVIAVRHDRRKEGSSNYTLSKLVRLYLNMFFNFSIKPIRLFTLIGVLLSIIGLIMAGVFIFWWMFISSVLPGWTSIITVLLIFQGIQLMFLGLVGEYLGKSYLDQNNTPQWVVKYIKNDKP